MQTAQREVQNVDAGIRRACGSTKRDRQSTQQTMATLKLTSLIRSA